MKLCKRFYSLKNQKSFHPSIENEIMFLPYLGCPQNVHGKLFHFHDFDPSSGSIHPIIGVVYRNYFLPFRILNDFIQIYTT